MPQFAVRCPLDEADLNHDFGTRPVHAKLGQPRRLGERRSRYFERVESTSKIQQQFGVEAGAELAGEDEIILIEVPDQQGTEADAGTLRIGESADNQLL